jgi:hypothetical protein
MSEQGWLAEQFEQNRQHLEAVAYSMLGSVSEAQDAGAAVRGDAGPRPALMRSRRATAPAAAPG